MRRIRLGVMQENKASIEAVIRAEGAWQIKF